MHAQVVIYTLRLGFSNRWSRRPIVGECDVDVSVTTYGVRTRRVWRTLETIGRGTRLPRSIVLWHEDPAWVMNPPASLRRLQRRGLTIKHCPDYGPHKKYFPHVMEGNLRRPLVTADDDVLYPRGWLRGLLANYRPDLVVAYRVKVITDGPYASWPACASTVPSFGLLPTGVSGVIYPPSVLEALYSRGDQFMRVCPRADDFWLHYAAVAVGVPTRQVWEAAANWWPTRPNEKGLEIHNALGGGNDAISEVVRNVWLGPTPTGERE
ncbi:MAG: hypothetical protein ACKOI2_01025 [Actinomycetota bacterium]